MTSILQKKSNDTSFYTLLLSIYTLFWVNNLICSLGGRMIWFILQWNKSFLIASLRSISSFQYFAWPARCLCNRKWAKKEKYSEFRHLPRDAGTRHLDGWRVASLAKCWRGDGLRVPVAHCASQWRKLLSRLSLKLGTNLRVSVEDTVTGMKHVIRSNLTRPRRSRAPGICQTILDF